MNSRRVIGLAGCVFGIGLGFMRSRRQSSLPSRTPQSPNRRNLLEHLTDEDILEEVLANNHRYKPEPLFSKTGVGNLSSASVLAKIRAVPPTASQRLKQRRRISVAIGLGLNEVHRGLLVGLFRG